SIYIGGGNKIESIIGFLTIFFFAVMIITFSFTAILYIIKGLYSEQATGALLASSIFMFIFILSALFYLYLVKR
ncbi:hypothetical protein, partial [Staphylococcus epidermidis]|uniref:hypothetical protein n=1 Tax=Staphylococcus epidermidis TaxID=1282 RepID=UPI0039B6A498